MRSRDQPAWHPLLEAVEGPTGVWTMYDTWQRSYAHIRIVRVEGEPRYRCELYGVLEGYAGTLKSGCERMHGLMILIEQGQSRAGRGINGAPGEEFDAMVRRRDEWRAAHR